MAVVNPEIDYVAADAETDMPTPSDMAREQMASLGLNAPSILSSRNETRTKEEIDADRQTLVEQLPGVGEVVIAKDIVDDVSSGNYASAGLNAAALGVGFLPAGDILNKPIRAAAKKLRKFNKTREAYKLLVQKPDSKLYPLFVQANKNLPEGDWLEAEFPETAFLGKTAKSDEARLYVPTKGAEREPKLYFLDDKQISKEQYDALGNNRKPDVKVIKGEKTKGTGTQIRVPDKATADKLKKEGFKVSKPTEKAPYGTVEAVAGRGGFHASQAPVATHLGPEDIVVSNEEVTKLLDAGMTPDAVKTKVFSYTPDGKPISKENIKKLSKEEQAKVVKKPVNYIKRRAEDQVFAVVDMADDVDYQSMLAKEGKTDLRDGVPKGGSYRYSDGQADSDQWVVGGDMKIQRVLSREEARAIQKEKNVTDLLYKDEIENILGRKFAKGGIVMDDYLVGKTMDEPQNFAEGGMPVAKQMEMFEDGGLLQEGGTVDPVSGNDVPPGSTQKEVRDDIPANLSEGEFVMPADVVRFHGLDKMMALRDEAKMGLQKMEDMGQMGNSEEATIPDDVPFSLDDLDMEDDGVQDFQVGGFVQQPFGTTPLSGTGIQGYQTSQFANYTPQYSAPPIPTTTPYKAPTQQATPTAQTTNIPTFEQSVKPTSVTYVNAAGAEIQIPVDAQGNPLIPVPEGFSKKGTATDAPTVPTEPVPQPSLAPQQKQKVDDGSDPMTPEELAEQRENQARISARKEAAKQLGYTNQVGAFEYLAGELIPAVGMMNKYDAGDIMPDGTISDGAGGTFDPITGARESVKGGILGNMANEIAGVFGGGTKAEDAKISPAAKAMGLSPASMAGLMTIAGNQSINEAIGKPTLPGGMGTKPEQVTPETTQVETTLGKTAVTEASKAAEPTTVSEAAKVEATPDNILASIGLKDKANLEEFKKKGGTIKVTDSGIVQTIMPGIGIRGGDVISSYSPNGTFIRQDTSATAESTTRGEYDIVSPSTTRKSPADVTSSLIQAAISRPSTREREPSNNANDLIASAARSSTRDRTKEGVQDMITREGEGGFNKQFSDDIKAGNYDRAFAERDSFQRDLARDIQKSERQEISNAAKEGRSANVSSRPAGPGEVSDGRGNVVRSSDGTSVKSGSPPSSSKGRAIAAEREQRNEDNSTDSRVICTELYRQGILNKQLYRLDVLYTARNLSPTLIRGYHYWAIPTVDLMRKSPALTKFLTYFTIKRAEEIAHIMNPVAYPKSTFTGRFIKTVGEGLCYAIGKVVKQKDYSILYNGKSV